MEDIDNVINHDTPGCEFSGEDQCILMTKQQFDKIQKPDLIKKHLKIASLYLAGYELLKSSIIDDVKDFFIVSDYNAEVVQKHKKLFEASCLWLAKVGAISQNDVIELQSIREHRNKIAHDLPTLLIDDEYNIDISLLRKMKYYIDTIGKFWVKLYTDADQSVIPDSEIRTGRDLLFEYLISIVDEE